MYSEFCFFFCIDNKNTNYPWDTILSRDGRKLLNEDNKNAAQNFVFHSREQNRRARKIRNKHEGRLKIKKLYPARVNESDILEFKKKESKNTGEKFGKQKDTKPFSGIQTSNKEYL